MDKIKELKARAQEAIDKMRAMLDLADGEKRDLTDEETAQYAAMETEADQLQRDIERLEKLEEREAKNAAGGDKPYRVSFKRTTSTPSEFRNLGEFI